ncbi:hypothetical protein QJS04_geneDACA016661 [Acorus gramineus]|uniref:Uncharacterized protein n=1 Tax=Acorus gramineus TaxID=55184 RepID=A0AAV9ATU3_ACOGR|nr:hypothetical protein QJS04_geneDACA016661 [Acorus gramineus]
MSNWDGIIDNNPVELGKDGCGGRQTDAAPSVSRDLGLGCAEGAPGLSAPLPPEITCGFNRSEPLQQVQPLLKPLQEVWITCIKYYINHNNKFNHYHYKEFYIWNKVRGWRRWRPEEGSKDSRSTSQIIEGDERNPKVVMPIVGGVEDFPKERVLREKMILVIIRMN